VSTSTEDLAWIRENMQRTIAARRDVDPMLEMTIGGTIAVWFLVFYDASIDRPLWWAAIPITSTLVFRLLKRRWRNQHSN